jgi:hypothetical protein
MGSDPDGSHLMGIPDSKLVSSLMNVYQLLQEILGARATGAFGSPAPRCKYSPVADLMQTYHGYYGVSVTNKPLRHEVVLPVTRQENAACLIEIGWAWAHWRHRYGPEQA